MAVKQPISPVMLICPDYIVMAGNSQQRLQWWLCTSRGATTVA